MTEHSLRALRIAGGIVGTLLAVGGLVYSYVFRFQNPELTQTELMMRMWWVYVVVLVGGVGALFCLAKGTK